MPTIAAPQTEQVIYAVVGYVAGKRGALKVSEQVPCSSAEAAERRARKLMDAGRVIRVDVVRQVCDPEAGEYEEPEYLLRLGRDPDLG